MCARLGIRHVMSQSYHHQANGRAEMAGQQLMEVLRKIDAEEGWDWVTALPRTLDLIHDLKGESGLSPYQILFGRERSMCGLSYVPERECEDAEDFFNRMENIDERVARVLNKKHEEQVRSLNAKRMAGPAFTPR